MKKTVLFALLIAGPLSVRAQENIIKASLLFGNAGVQYERAIGKHFSLGGQVGFAFINVSDYKPNQFTTGFGYYFEGRYYFSRTKGKMQGWHIGPSINILETSDNDYNADYKTTIYGLNTGSQWIYKSNLTFEFLLGAGYKQTIHERVNGRPGHDIGKGLPVSVQAGVSLGYAF